jgi:hypothetical protein
MWGRDDSFLIAIDLWPISKISNGVEGNGLCKSCTNSGVEVEVEGGMIRHVNSTTAQPSFSLQVVYPRSQARDRRPAVGAKAEVERETWRHRKTKKSKNAFLESDEFFVKYIDIP